MEEETGKRSRFPDYLVPGPSQWAQHNGAPSWSSLPAKDCRSDLCGQSVCLLRWEQLSWQLPLNICIRKNWIAFWASRYYSVTAAKSLQSCPTLCDPIDGSPPGSPVPGILQARTLEWVAIAFSNAWKWKVKVKSLSCVRLFSTPWIVAHQALVSMGFSKQEYWIGLPFLPSEDLPHPVIKPASPAWAGRLFTTEPAGKPIGECQFIPIHILSCKDPNSGT